jgi:hypothetical protein
MAHSYSSEYLLRKAIKAARARARPAGWEKMGMDERASAIYREKCKLEAGSAALAMQIDSDDMIADRELS